MYVSTSEDVFAYQGIGGASEANQGMFFVPPLSCESRGDINNIALIDEIGDNTRRYFHYKMDSKILNFYAFFLEFFVVPPKQGPPATTIKGTLFFFNSEQANVILVICIKLNAPVCIRIPPEDTNRIIGCLFFILWETPERKHSPTLGLTLAPKKEKSIDPTFTCIPFN